MTQEQALANVRLVESLLSSWNDYRQSLVASVKAGKRFARSVEALQASQDKTCVAGELCFSYTVELYVQDPKSPILFDELTGVAQALRPSGTVIDYSADVMAKLAKKVEKDYEGANAGAGKYFALLAVSTLIGIFESCTSLYKR